MVFFPFGFLIFQFAVDDVHFVADDGLDVFISTEFD